MITNYIQQRQFMHPSSCELQKLNTVSLPVFNIKYNNYLQIKQQHRQGLSHEINVYAHKSIFKRS